MTYWKCRLPSRKLMMEFDVVRQIRAIPLLSAERETELYVEWKSGNLTSKQQLVRRYLPFVLSVCKRYAKYGIDSIIGVGTEGLYRAVESRTYSPPQKRLRDIAWFPVNDAIRDYLWNDRLIRLPCRKYYRQPRLQLLYDAARYSLSLQFDTCLSDKSEVRVYEPVGSSIDLDSTLDIEWALSKLSSKHERVVRGWLCGYSFREIAKAEGVHLGVPSKWFKQALNRLRDLLKAGDTL